MFNIFRYFRRRAIHAEAARIRRLLCNGATFGESDRDLATRKEHKRRNSVLHARRCHIRRVEAAGLLREVTELNKRKGVHFCINHRTTAFIKPASHSSSLPSVPEDIVGNGLPVTGYKQLLSTLPRIVEINKLPPLVEVTSS